MKHLAQDTSSAETKIGSYRNPKIHISVNNFFSLTNICRGPDAYDLKEIMMHRKRFKRTKDILNNFFILVFSLLILILYLSGKQMHFS